MDITYNNKNKIREIYLHDFIIKEFIYNNLEKYIIIRCKYSKKEIYLKFTNVKYCEMFAIEEWGDGLDIFDWGELPDNEKFTNKQTGIKAVGMGIEKVSGDCIKIYCEKIEVEEKELHEK